MVAKSHFGSNSASKVFTMSPEEENYRTKLQRIDSPYISTAVPVLVPSFGRPASSVFTFTATKNEQSHINPLVPASRKGISRMRCRLCNRPKVTKVSSTTRELRPLRRDDNTSQVNPFITSSVSFKQSEPSRLLVNRNVNAKLIDGLKSQYIPAAAESTATACANLFSTSSVPPDNQICHPVKNLEDADQIVKKASEMVKLLESHISALQLSTQALETPSKSMIAVTAPPLNSYSNLRNEEPINHFKQATHKLMETSMPLLPPLFPASVPANSFNQQSPSFLNFSPATTFPCQSPSPAPSLSYSPIQSQSPFITCPCQTPSPIPSLSYPPSQPQSPDITCPYQTPTPAPTLSQTPRQHQGLAPSQILERSPKQRPSSIPSQKTSSAASLNVKITVRKLESLSMSPNQYVQTPNPTPKYINEFTFPPLRTQTMVDKDNKFKTPTKAGTAASFSSGVSRHFRPPKTQGQTRLSALTSKARPPTSKRIRFHRLPPRHYDDDSGSSVSSSTSWTTTDQSASGSESSPEETDACTYSSSAESSRTPESEYSTETTSLSPTSPINRPRLSISIPHSFNRRRNKKKTSAASNEKPISRLRKIKNKLGLIFHHHHHHHHHHHEEEKPKPLRTKLTVVRQEAAAAKRRDQQGHFRALLKGLVRHVRSNKKKKKSEPLNEIRRLKKKVQFGKVAKRRRGLKLPKINKKSKFKAVRK